MSDKPENPELSSSASLTEAPMPVVPPGKSNKGRRFSHEEWDAMYHVWKAGERNKTHLAARFHCSEDTVHKFVLKGLPVHSWPSFLDRLRLEQNVSDQTKAKIAESIAKTVTDEYGQVKEETMKLLRVLRGACTVQVQKMIRVLESTPMTRSVVQYSVTDTGVTTRKTVERPLDAVEVASVARALSTAISVTSKMESLWLGGPTERIENVPESEKISQADLDYINSHDGELPPGMTIEQFIARGARAYGVSLGPPQN